MIKRIILSFGLVLLASPIFSYAQSVAVTANPVSLTAKAGQCVEISKDVYLGVNRVSEKEHVISLQAFLNLKGYVSNDSVTGYFGPITRNAVVKFQRDNGIQNTGYVGPVTRAKIKAVSCDSIYEQKPIDSLTLVGTTTSSTTPPFANLILNKPFNGTSLVRNASTSIEWSHINASSQIPVQIYLRKNISNATSTFVIRPCQVEVPRTNNNPSQFLKTQFAMNWKVGQDSSGGYIPSGGYALIVEECGGGTGASSYANITITDPVVPPTGANAPYIIVSTTTLPSGRPTAVTFGKFPTDATSWTIKMECGTTGVKIVGDDKNIGCGKTFTLTSTSTTPYPNLDYRILTFINATDIRQTVRLTIVASFFPLRRANIESHAILTILPESQSNSNPNIRVLISTTTVGQGQPFNLVIDSADADNDDLMWDISWGDGTNSTFGNCYPNTFTKKNWNFNIGHMWVKAGTYTIDVTAKDCRGGIASKRMTITVTPTTTLPIQVIITSPDGGENWYKGDTQPITWTYALPVCRDNSCVISSPIFDITLYRKSSGDEAYPPYTIARNITGAYFSWSVGQATDIYNTLQTVPDGEYKIEICDVNSKQCDASNNFFMVRSRVISTYPETRVDGSVKTDDGSTKYSYSSN